MLGQFSSPAFCESLSDLVLDLFFFLFPLRWSFSSFSSSLDFLSDICFSPSSLPQLFHPSLSLSLLLSELLEDPEWMLLLVSYFSVLLVFLSCSLFFSLRRDFDLTCLPTFSDSELGSLESVERISFCFLRWNLSRSDL